MSKVEIQFLKEAKWADKPTEPQFYVQRGTVKKVSPELAEIIIQCGAGRLFDPDEPNLEDEETNDDQDLNKTIDDGDAGNGSDENNGGDDGDGDGGDGGAGGDEDKEKTEPKSAAELKMDDLGLAAAIVNKLSENQITTVEHLVGKTDQEVLDLNGIGQGKVDDIKESLAKFGLGLKEGE